MPTLGIHREPALLYTFLLREEFTNAPEGRGSKDTEERREVDIRNEKGYHTTTDTDEQIDNPGTRAPVILCFDNDGMPDADGEKGHRGNGNASKIHVLLKFDGRNIYEIVHDGIDGEAGRRVYLQLTGDVATMGNDRIHRYTKVIGYLLVRHALHQ